MIDIKLDTQCRCVSCDTHVDNDIKLNIGNNVNILKSLEQD